MKRICGRQPGKQTRGAGRRERAPAKAQGERVHPSRSTKDSPCDHSPGDEVGNNEKGDQEIDGSRHQEPVSCDKVLTIILRALGGH